DWREEHEVARLPLPPGASPDRLGFTPDGGRLLCAATDGSLRAWDLWGRRETVLWKSRGPGQRLMDFSPTGSHAVARPDDQPQIFLLDVHKGTQKALGGLPDAMAF